MNPKKELLWSLRVYYRVCGCCSFRQELLATLVTVSLPIARTPLWGHPERAVTTGIGLRALGGGGISYYRI